MQTDEKNLNIIFKKILTVLIVSILFCAFCAVICNISAVKSAKYENTFEDYSTKNQENSEKFKFDNVYDWGKWIETEFDSELTIDSIYNVLSKKYENV